MAMITLTGTVRWAKVHKPDSKYNYYGVELKPDAESIATLLAAGITTIKPSKDGEGYYSFKRRPDQIIWKDKVQQTAGPPMVMDADGNGMTDAIGNGSKVRILVDVFPYNNTFGKGVSCRLDGVQVLELVRFEAENKTDGPKLKIMF